MALMNGPLDSMVESYLAERRALGFLLHDSGRLLHDFARFVDGTSPGQPITTAIAIQWACLRPTGRPRRLDAVRGFACYCAITDPRTQIPSARLLGPRYVRRAPHIFTPEQVTLIMQRAASLPKISPSRPHTFETFFGLLACTGLRAGEARRLRCHDFDPNAGTLLVPATKFSPERLLPLHRSTVRALVRYQKLRKRLVPFGEHFFVSLYGRPLRTCLIDRAFRSVTTDMPCNGDRPRPRPHDFRHTFATNWVAQWSREARPLSHYLLRLASYLGHRNMAMTWWYVSGDQRALDAAAEQFGRYRHGRDLLPHER